MSSEEKAPPAPPAPPKLPSNLKKGLKKKANKKSSQRKNKEETKKKARAGPLAQIKKRGKNEECKRPEFGEEGNLTEDQALKAFTYEVTQQSFRGQAEFFMNAFWKDFFAGKDKKDKAASKLREDVWHWRIEFENLARLQKKRNCHDLEQFQANRFLEIIGQTMTSNERRGKLSNIDVDGNGRMSLLEYLVFRFEVKVQELMNRPQGTSKLLEAAQESLENVMNIIAGIEAEKTKLAKESEGTGVKANVAKAKLAQLTSKDNTPLNRALVTAQAKLRKLKKNPDKDCMGKQWFLEKELSEAARYKPSGGIDKSRFSIAR